MVERVFRGVEIAGRPEDEELVARLAAEVGSPGVEQREADDGVLYRLYFPPTAPRETARGIRARWLRLGGTPAAAPRAFEEPECDWGARARGSFRGTRVGPFWIGPPWVAAPKDRLAIRINPGRAFGTGLHPTTRVALRLLTGARPAGAGEAREPAGARGTRSAGPLRGARVLDVGTGSGILAIASLALGASRVTALDVDLHALANAAENRSLNAGSGRLDLVAGSPSALATVREFDVVLANLEAPILLPLLPELARALAPAGRLLASGVTVGQRLELVEAAARRGLRVRRRASESGWWGALLEADRSRPRARRA
jgi:ribosomal protein L11 methyltransferase